MGAAGSLGYTVVDEPRAGSAIEGRIGPSGVVRVEGIEPGGYAVSFPRLDASAWEPVAAPARGVPP